MSAITLKNIPRGLHEVLRHNAENHRRSLNNEIIFYLEDALGIKNQNTNNLLEEARNMRAKFRFSINDKDIADFKTAGRK
jgi:plasmid stability protein